MSIVYKVVVTAQEEESNGGYSASVPQISAYCLFYRKDEPTTGPHPLFAFTDLPSAQTFAGNNPNFAIWEAETPSCEPVPEWLPDSIDYFIDHYWPHADENIPGKGWGGHGSSPPSYWRARNENPIDISWRLSPPGTVLCPSITLRRRLDKEEPSKIG